MQAGESRTRKSGSTASGASPTPPTPAGRVGRRPSALGRKVAWLLGAWHLLLLLVTLPVVVRPEIWWWSGALLYLPGWLWLLPQSVTLIVAAVFARPWIPGVVLGAAWIAGPVMGLAWPRPQPAAIGPTHRLRVMTYNVRGQADDPGVLAEILSANADVYFFQEMPAPTQPLRGALRGYRMEGDAGCWIASRLPCTVAVRPLPESGGRRYLVGNLRGDGFQATICGLHLNTPRDGIHALIGDKLEGVQGFKASTSHRIAQARHVTADLMGLPRPMIVAGDLNAPVQSEVCRRLMSLGLRDCFLESGWGYGYTYGHSLRFRVSYVRIDHILVGTGIRALGCHVGSADGSDHRPVIADLEIPGS